MTTLSDRHEFSGKKGRHSVSLFFHKWLPVSLLYLAPLLLFTYTALRAYGLSITHDEAGSFAIWTNFDIFTCRTNPDCWGTANLHWLYVLLMKMTVGLFGDSELAIRLPALLGHLVYLFFSFKLVKWIAGGSVTNRPWLMLLGFLLLNINAYLLEFFSLARGYGLAMSMMMMSLYFLARWVGSGSWRSLMGALGGAFLAVLSNFTMLVYFACLLAAIGGVVVLAFFRQEKNRLFLLKSAAGAGLAFSGMLAWLLHKPIEILRQRGEFDWGVGSFWETYKSVVHCSLYGGRYLKMYNLEVFGGLFFVLLLAVLWFAVSNFLKKPGDTAARFLLAAVLLPLLATLAALMQHWILGTQYQVNRTALMFIPLCSLAVFLFFQNWLAQKNRRWRVLLPAVVGVFCVFHFGRVAQLRYTSEWGYDAETKAMMAYLDAKIPESQQIKLGVHWLYHPSASYYLKKVPYHFTAPLTYSKDLRTDGFYDYYYVQPSDVATLPGYVLEKQFSWVGCLLRKK